MCTFAYDASIWAQIYSLEVVFMANGKLRWSMSMSPTPLSITPSADILRNYCAKKNRFWGAASQKLFAGTERSVA